MEVVFWISLSLLFYTYLGYGLLLSLVSVLSRKQAPSDETFVLPVTVVVAAYNEEACIEAKIQNCQALQYPPGLLTLLFVSDGSTDNTAAIINNYPSLFHLHQPERRGKTAALNRAMSVVTTPVVVFTDANAMLHPGSLQKIVRRYQNDDVGGVSGEKRIADGDDSAVGTGERLYWKYESMLKKADADFYTVIGAAGELFSIRTVLFEPLAEDIILDDFVVSARVCQKGYRFAYEKQAYAVEAASENFREERARKVRISAGCFQALVLLKNLLNPLRNWRLTFQYISHRVLRWTVCPLLVPVVFISNAVLAFQQEGYLLLFLMQCLFYSIAILGWRAAERKRAPKSLYVPYYFVFMNLSLYIGFYRFLTGMQSVIWKKAARKM